MEPKADPHDYASPRIYLFQEEACSLLVGLLNSETDPMVLSAVISALGHLRMTWCLPTMVPFSEHEHPDVRFAMAFAVGRMPNEAAAISTLQRLTSDTDSDVRDWAPMLSTMVEEDWDYSLRTHEAAVELLGLIVEPEGWTAAECRVAMRAAGYWWSAGRP